MTNPEQARLRLTLTPALGSSDWFDRQLDAIRATGAQYDGPSRTWFRWLDAADLDALAAALTAAATAAREFGTAVLVETGEQVRAGAPA